METYIKKPFLLVCLVLTFAAGGQSLLDAQPDWWTEYSLIDGVTPEDDAAATIGQAKHAVQKSYQYLEAELAPLGGAGAEVTTLYNSFCMTAPVDPASDLQLLTIGQLKYLAKPFYDRLNREGVGFDTRTLNPASTDIYPWTTDQSDDADNALATLGQLKFAFSFDLSTWSSPSEPPVLVTSLADLYAIESGHVSTINLYEAFEDAWTSDVNLQFNLTNTNPSLISTNITDGVLTLNYARGIVGTAIISVTATDDSETPLSTSDTITLEAFDTDSDNLRDSWENYYFSDLDEITMGDPDNDGYPNIYEFFGDVGNPDDMLIFPGPTHTVAKDGSKNYTELQSAINAVTEAYSIVLVEPGVYTGTGNTNFTIYYSDPTMLIISSDGAESTILDGGQSRRGGQISNDKSALVGFTIQNCTSYQGGGLHITGSEVLVAKCKIYNNTSQLYGGGIYITGNDTYVKGCEIYQNVANVGAGLYVSNVSGLRVYNTLVYKNESTRGGGFYFANTVSTSLTHTTICNNSASTGNGKEMHIVGGVPADIVLTNSIVWNDNSDTSIIVGTDVSANHSIIKGTSGYINDGTVINIDPQLTPQALLSAASDGIATNQGIDTGLYFDIHGEVRPDGSGYDIGADEFIDSDSDGLPDWLEALGATNPSDDTDGDGLSNLYEYENSFDALNPDIDKDNISDGDEVNLYQTDPFNPDTDSDEMFDGEEILNGLNPLDNDAMDDLDGDGYPNIYEVRNGTDTQNTNSQIPDIPSPTLTVDLNGSTPYSTLQSGIDAITSDYSTILVKAGNYRGSGNADFIIGSNDPRILIISEGNAENTTLNGEGLSRGGQIANSFSGLVGVTISNCTEAQRGGGLYVTGNEIFIAQCTIKDNKAIINSGISQGGGIYTSGSDMRIEDCEIHDNKAGKGAGVYVVSTASGFRMQNTSIYRNKANYQGSGIQIESNEVLITKCKIHYNQAASGDGGGMFINGDNIHVESCEIHHNTARGGAGLHASTNVSGFKLQNTLIHQNKSTDTGGGLHFSIGSKALLIHTTVYNNSAPIGNEIYNYSDVPAEVVLTNSIVWNDNSDENVLAGRNFSASYSIIRGTSGYVSDGTVINTDPRLTPQGLLTAASGGIAIDEGADTVVGFDIQGETRPDGNGYDIGADEFKDSDSDDLPDWLEALGVTDPSGDEDGDQLDNLYEFENSLDIFDPDTDGDGFTDGQEVYDTLTDPLIADSEAADVDLNSDGINDRIGFLLGIDNTQTDNDGDSLSNEQELILGTNPNSADTDGDGANDSVDEFPFDPNLTSRPIDAGDISSPVITLLTPSHATTL